MGDNMIKNNVENTDTKVKVIDMLTEAAKLINEAKEDDKEDYVRNYIKKPFEVSEIKVVKNYQKAFADILATELDVIANCVNGKIVFLKSLLKKGEISKSTFFDAIGEIILHDHCIEDRFRAYVLLLFRIDYYLGNDVVFNDNLEINDANSDSGSDDYLNKIGFCESILFDSDEFDFDDENDDIDEIDFMTTLYVLGFKKSAKECQKFLEENKKSLGNSYELVLRDGMKAFEFFTVREAYDILLLIKDYFVCFIEKPCIKGRRCKLFQQEF